MLWQFLLISFNCPKFSTKSLNQMRTSFWFIIAIALGCLLANGMGERSQRAGSSNCTTRKSSRCSSWSSLPPPNATKRWSRRARRQLPGRTRYAPRRSAVPHPKGMHAPYTRNSVDICNWRIAAYLAPRMWRGQTSTALVPASALMTVAKWAETGSRWARLRFPSRLQVQRCCTWQPA